MVLSNVSGYAGTPKLCAPVLNLVHSEEDLPQNDGEWEILLKRTDAANYGYGYATICFGRCARPIEDSTREQNRFRFRYELLGDTTMRRRTFQVTGEHINGVGVYFLSFFDEKYEAQYTKDGFSALDLQGLDDEIEHRICTDGFDVTEKLAYSPKI